MKAGRGASPLNIDWGEVWDVVGPIVYGYAKDQVGKGINDDVFPPQSVSVDIGSPYLRWGDGTKLSPAATVDVRRHNRVYDVSYFWGIKTV